MIDFQDRRIQIVALVLALLLVFLGVKAVKRSARGNDFFAHHVGKAILAGEQVYPGGETSEHIPGPDHIGYGHDDRFWYLYSPAPAIFMTPLAYLPEWAAHLVWFCAKAVMLGLCFVVITKIFEAFQLPRPTVWVLFVALLILARFFENDFINGQINLPILFMVLVSVWSYASGREALSGFILAAALTVKQPVLLFVAFWGMRFRWKVLAGWAAGVVICFYLAPGLIVGFPKIHAYNVQWFQTTLYSPDGDSFAQTSSGQVDAQNDSMLGLLSKFLAHSNAASHRPEPVYVNVVDLPPAVVSNMHKVFAVLAAFGLWGLTFLRGPTEKLANWRLLCELAIVGNLCLLISPVSHKAHFVLLLLSAVVAAYGAWQLKPGNRLLLGSVALAFVLCMFRTKMTTEYGAVTITAIVLLIANLYLHFRTTDEELTAAEPGQPGRGGLA